MRRTSCDTIRIVITCPYGRVTALLRHCSSSKLAIRSYPQGYLVTMPILWISHATETIKVGETDARSVRNGAVAV